MEQNKIVGFNKDNLYVVQTLVDPEAGMLTVWHPVDILGGSRIGAKARFFSSIMGNVRGVQVPIEFEIADATTLEQAIGLWKQCADEAGRRFTEQQTAPKILAPSGGRLN